MKARWQALAAHIEARSERERILGFAAAVLLLVYTVQAAVIAPALAEEKLLQERVRQQGQDVARIDATIAEQARVFAIDPDSPLRERLQGVQVESNRLSEQLRNMERGLVAPERMAPLLETMLRANGRLRLVSMKTLPASPLSAVARESLADRGTAGPPAPDLLFRHGVELTVRGSYLDLVDYMNTLETLPTQLFWGEAQLEVEDYPTVRLTLTLYTLSLDTKWMKL
jgi:MSHA biogenesis protein MshJ